MNDLIDNPPALVVIAIVLVAAAHIVLKLVELVVHRPTQNGVIPLIETFVVFLLGYLCVHSYYETMFADHPVDWYNQPLPLVALLVGFALASMALYIVFRKAVPDENIKRKRGRVEHQKT